MVGKDVGGVEQGIHDSTDTDAREWYDLNDNLLRQQSIPK
jgi:hypothetical protein